MAKSAMQELISAITGNGHIIINQTLIDTYLGKEKQQIIDSYWAGINGSINDWDESYIVGNEIKGIKEGGGAEKYYNEKYNKNK